MAKSLNDLARELKDYIIELQTDARNKSSINRYRYNNLKLEIMDPRTNKISQVKVTIGISEAIFNIDSGEKAAGSLGPDERYVLRWFMKNSVLNDLQEAWRGVYANQGKAKSDDE